MPITKDIQASDHRIVKDVQSNYAGIDISGFQELKTYLTNAGIWAKLDFINVSIGWTSGELATNEHLKNQIDGSLITLENITHSNTIGFSANSVLSRINWNYTPGTNYKLGDASFGAFINNITPLTPGDDVVCVSGSSSAIERNNSGDTESGEYRINGSQFNISDSFSSGLIFISTNGDTDILFLNNMFYASNSTETILATGFNSLYNFSDTKVKIAFQFAGKYLTQQEVIILNNALTTFFNNVNA